MPDRAGSDTAPTVDALPIVVASLKGSGVAVQLARFQVDIRRGKHICQMSSLH